jgi:hypothetical protein
VNRKQYERTWHSVTIGFYRALSRKEYIMAEVSRRDAVKFAAASAAALAATNFLSSGTPLQPAPAEALTALRHSLSGKTVRLGFGPSVTPESIHKALETLFEISGCLACGLLGFDIHFHGVNPDPVVQKMVAVEQLEGVHFADIFNKVAP